MALATTEKPETFKEVIGKMGGAEKTTEVVFFFGAYSSQNIEKLRELTKGKVPNVIVVEGEKNPYFQKMIKGDITVDEYLRIWPYKFYNPESGKRMLEFYKELYEKGAKVEQLNSGLHIGGLIQRMEADKVRISSIVNGDFEKEVDATVKVAKIEADFFKVEKRMRAEEIAEKIKTGEWNGYILVEAGALHTRVKNILRGELREMENVSINSSYVHAEDAGKVFGRGVSEVYDPMNELIRMYVYEKEPAGKKLKEREKLLGARSAIFCEVSKTSKARDMFEATKLVNQLSYEECKKLFDKMHSNKMNEETAFRYVENFLKKKAELYSL
ncbi:MAG: hypothetical protein NT130_04110 [Candidatus Micrarchaeota archaeon]|nr:hypothetical protein [Candidatus Micrarchaeota archaeon]